MLKLIWTEFIYLRIEAMVCSSDIVKCGEFLDKPRNYYCLKKYYVA
jgi:hypothetical protein